MPRSSKHGRDAAAGTTAPQFPVVLRQQVFNRSTETKKQVSAPMNEAAVFSSSLDSTRHVSTSSSLPSRRFAAKFAPSYLFRRRRETLGAALCGSATGKATRNSTVKTVRKGDQFKRFFPAVAHRAAPQRESLPGLCADCGHQIGESTEIHPSLCPVCENKIIQSATGWNLKKEQQL